MERGTGERASALQVPLTVQLDDVIKLCYRIRDGPTQFSRLPIFGNILCDKLDCPNIRPRGIDNENAAREVAASGMSLLRVCVVPFP